MRMKLLALSVGLLVAVGVGAATISRITTFTDGTILFASDLNAEFNNIINLLNGGLDNDNLAANANIAPTKISTVIDGNGIGRDSGTGALSVNVDNSTIEIASDNLRVKDGGITTIKISTAAITTDRIALNAVTTQLIADNSVTAAKLTTNAVTNSKILAGAVTNDKRNTVSVNTPSGNIGEIAISNSSGSFSTTSTSYVDITNLDISLATTGRPILIYVIPADNSEGWFGVNDSNSNETNCYVRLVFDNGANVLGTRYYSVIDGSAPGTHPLVYVPLSSVNFVYATGAGSHFMRLQMKAGPGAIECTAVNARLVAFEL